MTHPGVKAVVQRASEIAQGKLEENGVPAALREIAEKPGEKSIVSEILRGPRGQHRGMKVGEAIQRAAQSPFGQRNR